MENLFERRARTSTLVRCELTLLYEPRPGRETAQEHRLLYVRSPGIHDSRSVAEQTAEYAAHGGDARHLAPPTRPPAGRWTAPGRAGIKAMLNGSPPSNRNGRGPG